MARPQCGRGQPGTGRRPGLAYSSCPASRGRSPGARNPAIKIVTLSSRIHNGNIYLADRRGGARRVLFPFAGGYGDLARPWLRHILAGAFWVVGA